MLLVSLKYQCLSIGPYYIQPLLFLTSSIPFLFLSAFSCPLYYSFYSSWCIFFSPLFPLIYSEQGKEKLKTFEECHVMHTFSMCNIEHNRQFLQKGKTWKFEFSYTLTKQFLPYFFTFHLDQNMHDAFFKSDVKHHRLWKTKTKTVSYKVRNAEPKNNSETTLLKTIHSNSSILILPSTKIPQKNITFLHRNFLHYLNMIIKL